ncbi:MAG: hypothetical protein M3O94_04870 [Actinomycetota bacterium]|nr:hypothetical protein [Actinomycetota bacterium]
MSQQTSWYDVRPFRPIEILDDDRWIPGQLEGWSHDEHNYRDGSGRVGFVTAEHVRPVEEPAT